MWEQTVITALSRGMWLIQQQIESAASQRTWEASVIICSAAQSNQSDAVASINEYLPFYELTKLWDDNETLSEVYKLQSNILTSIYAYQLLCGNKL